MNVLWNQWICQSSLFLGNVFGSLNNETISSPHHTYMWIYMWIWTHLHFFLVPNRIPSLTCLYSIEGEGKNIIICGIETYHSMFEISLRIILISLIDFLYIIFQIKLIYLERVLNYIFISCLKIAITLSRVSFFHSFIHSFIPPILLGSCMAGPESGLGLKWWKKQNLWLLGIHSLLYKAA